MDKGILDHPEAQAILADAVLDQDQLERLSARLGPFLGRYSHVFQRSEQRVNARLVIDGKLSSLSRKTCEPIAHAAGVPRESLQDFVGSSPWDDEALVAELRRHVVEEWADPEGVLTLDGSAFPKKGTHSCGVKRQWCGRLGKVDNCQVGVFVGYACASGHTLLDRRLYLPEEWADDADRRKKARVPEDVSHQEAWRIALDLLARCAGVPHRWVTADDEFGRVQEFRTELRRRSERYLVDVPSDTLVRDLDEAPPVQARRRGSLPKAPFRTAAGWAAMQPAGRWREVEVRDGEKGPIRVWALTTRVQTRLDGSRLGPHERLLVRRGPEGELSYHVSNAGAEAGLEELVRAKGEHHRVEQCFQEGKGEVGLGQYEVRSWVGWHHHVTLSMLALWFLALTRSGGGGGKSGADGERVARGAGHDAGHADHAGGRPARAERRPQTQGGGADLSLAPADRRIPATARGGRDRRAA